MLLLFSSLFFTVYAQIFVDTSAQGNNTGTSWDNAYIDLQDAIASSQEGDSIWVATGTYKPAQTIDPTASFVISKNMILRGGFPSGGGE